MARPEGTSDPGGDRLIALADRAIEGRLTRREVAELEGLFDQGLPYLQRYVHYVGLHAALYGLAGRDLLAQVPAALREADLAPVRAARRRRLAKKALARAGAAAAVLASTALGFWIFWRPVVAAVVAVSSQAIWSEPVDREQVRVGDELRLASGFADLRFSNGAEVSLRGPALLRVESADEVHLEYGQALAKVPPEAVGFTVRTPDGRLVDLGTEFLVTRGVGARTATTVRKGLVEAGAADGGSNPKRVAASEAAAFDAGTAGWVDAAPDTASLSAFDLKALGFEVLSGNVLLSAGGDEAFPDSFPAERPGVLFVPEGQAVRLKAAVEGIGPGGAPVRLAAGTVVNSYLLDGVGFGPGIWGANVSLISKRPVAAALVFVPLLAATDAGLGLPGLKYPRQPSVGVEVDHPSGADAVTISGDGRRIDLRLSAAPGEREQVRLLVPLGAGVPAGLGLAPVQ